MQMYLYSIPKNVIVEDKPTERKEGTEPDLFCIFKGSPAHRGSLLSLIE
jgi:hypothetical protein